jgi:hypothetical protein
MDNLGAVVGPLLSFLIVKFIIDDIWFSSFQLFHLFFVLILVVFVLEDVKGRELEKTRISLRTKGLPPSLKFIFFLSFSSPLGINRISSPIAS